jgi:hypothetical protein
MTLLTRARPSVAVVVTTVHDAVRSSVIGSVAMTERPVRPYRSRHAPMLGLAHRRERRAASPARAPAREVILDGRAAARRDEDDLRSMPAAAASSTANSASGLSTIGSSAFDTARVAGRSERARPATGITAFLTRHGCSLDVMTFRRPRDAPGAAANTMPCNASP